MLCNLRSVSKYNSAISYRDFRLCSSDQDAVHRLHCRNRLHELLNFCTAFMIAVPADSPNSEEGFGNLQALHNGHDPIVNRLLKLTCEATTADHLYRVHKQCTPLTDLLQRFLSRKYSPECTGGALDRTKESTSKRLNTLHKNV